MSKMRPKLRWGLNENFKMSGRWWLPDDEAAHCVGTLHCSPSKITLTLIGSLDAPSLESLGIVQKDFDRLPVVHGITDHGKKVTLINCVTTSRNHNFAT